MRTVATANIRSFKAIDEYEFELELTSDLPEEIGVGAALENLTWTPDVDIRNSFSVLAGRGDYWFPHREK